MRYVTRSWRLSRRLPGVPPPPRRAACAGSPPRSLVRSDDRARRGDQAAGRVWPERGAEVVDACRPGRRRREGGRSRSASALAAARGGRAGWRPSRRRRRRARSRRSSARPSSSTIRREALVERARPAARPVSRRRPGSRCARGRSSRRPLPSAASSSGSSASRPSSGLAVKASAPRPLTAPIRAGRLADERLGVCPGGDGHVAALAVGDAGAGRLSWVACDDRSSAAQPGAPRRSKHASCGLTATHAGPAASIAARSAARPRPLVRALRVARAPSAAPRQPRPRPATERPGRGRGRARSGYGAPLRAPPAGRRNCAGT